MSASGRKWSSTRATALGAALALSLELSAAPAAAEPESPQRQFYLDAHAEHVDFEPVYTSWFGPDRYRPNYLRAVLENVGVSVVEVAIYWFEPSLNIVDWQFPDLDSKLSSSEAVRFDDNLLRTNYLHHPLAGGAHYVLTRENGFGVPGAFLASATASTAYELLLEWRELVSINDLIVTPFGGMALGEFLHQLGGYLNSEPAKVRTEVSRSGSEIARGAARATLGLPRYAHDALDAPPDPISVLPDQLGLSSAYWHAFRLHVMQSSLEAGGKRPSQVLGLRGDLAIAAMPGFLRPGRFERWYGNGNFVSLGFDVSGAGDDREDEIVLDAHLAGRYAQNIEHVPGGREGNASETALASGLAYLDRVWAGQRDQYGIIHLPHPAQRVWFMLGPATLRLSADVSADFASVRSTSYDLFVARYGSAGTKSSLLQHSYFHGWGYSMGGAAAISLDAVELGASVRFGHYESIDGLERMQEQVTRDTHCVEEIRDLRVHLQLEPPGSIVSARIEASETWRDGSLDSAFDASRTYRKIGVGLGLVF